MAKREKLGLVIKGEPAPVTQTLNVVPQKVIQVDKPTGYYGDREKTKIFIY